MDGQLTSGRYGLLGALLSSDPSWYHFVYTGAFLVLFLNVMSCVPLTQLLFQIMILFDEAFHCSREGLDLSLQGSELWFVSLNVVVGHHRASKYHAILCLGSSSMANLLPIVDSN